MWMALKFPWTNFTFIHCCDRLDSIYNHTIDTIWKMILLICSIIYYWRVRQRLLLQNQVRKIALIKAQQQQKQKHKRVDISVMNWGEIITKRYGNLPLAFSICFVDNIGNNNITSTIVKCFLITYPWWRQMKHFPLHWPFAWGIHQSLVNSPHRGLCLQMYWYWWATEQLQHPKHIAIGSWL